MSRQVGWLIGWLLLLGFGAAVAWTVWLILPPLSPPPVYEPDLPRVTVSAGVVTPTCGIIAIDPVTGAQTIEGRC